MNNKLSSILLQKFKSNQLAHLYIIEPNKSDQEELCLNWTKELLQSFGPEKFDISNHQDILFLSPEKEAKQYNQNQLKEIFQFVNHEAIELAQKFLIIPKAQYLSEINANKLLKTFEEPPIKLTVLLINPQKNTILPTIQSRSIKLKLSFSGARLDNLLTHVISNDLSFIDFGKYVDEQGASPQLLLSQLLDLFNTSNASQKQLVELKKAISSIEQDILYNNSMQNIKLKIFHWITELKNA